MDTTAQANGANPATAPRIRISRRGITAKDGTTLPWVYVLGVAIVGAFTGLLGVAVVLGATLLYHRRKQRKAARAAQAPSA